MINRLSLCALFFSLMILAPFAHADGPFFSGGLAYAPMLSSDGHNYESTLPFSLRAGYWYHVFHVPVDTYLEYQQHQLDDGSGLLSISRIHRELTAWMRYRYPNKWRVKPYAAVGLGGGSDIVKTRFNGDSTVNTQSPEMIFGGAVGLSWRIAYGIEAQLEGRFTSASSFQPNPLLQMGAQLGYRF